jgi:hypothetical protein
MREPWFGPKSYGIGITPKSPAGWAAVAVYVLAMAATGPVVKFLAAPTWVIWPIIAGLAAAFLALTYIKSDRQPWRWRWGGR